VKTASVRSISNEQATQIFAKHDSDLVMDLSSRIHALSNYDKYIKNAHKHSEIRDFWNGVKDQEVKNINQMKKLIANEIENHCF
jgi:L-ribulose-5-phosphate 3-epimerase UlaE